MSTDDADLDFGEDDSFVEERERLDEAQGTLEEREAQASLVVEEKTGRSDSPACRSDSPAQTGVCSPEESTNSTSRSVEVEVSASDHCTKDATEEPPVQKNVPTTAAKSAGGKPRTPPLNVDALKRMAFPPPKAEAPPGCVPKAVAGAVSGGGVAGVFSTGGAAPVGGTSAKAPSVKQLLKAKSNDPSPVVNIPTITTRKRSSNQSVKELLKVSSNDPSPVVNIPTITTRKRSGGGAEEPVGDDEDEEEAQVGKGFSMSYPQFGKKLVFLRGRESGYGSGYRRGHFGDGRAAVVATLVNGMYKRELKKRKNKVYSNEETNFFFVRP